MIFVFRCKIPGLENDTYEFQSFPHQLFINQTIPFEDNEFDRCHVYTDGYVIYDNYSRPVNGSKVSCTEWVYETSVFKNTFTKKVSKF